MDVNDDGGVSGWRGWLDGRWRWVSEARILGALLLIVGCVYGFVEIADEVVDGDSGGFDGAVLRWFRDPVDPGITVGPGWLATAALDFTALGGTTVLLAVVIVTLGFLWMAGKRGTFWLFLVVTVGGQALSSGLKVLFGRARPDVVPHLAEVHTASFPSGHSMMSAVVYVTLGVLVCGLVRGAVLRGYILGVCVLVTGLVGVTRVFLGVHYPTDVLAGWTAGLAWALLCLVVVRGLEVWRGSGSDSSSGV